MPTQRKERTSVAEHLVSGASALAQQRRAGKADEDRSCQPGLGALGADGRSFVLSCSH